MKASITSSSTETVLIPVANSSVTCEKVLSNQRPSTHMPAVKVKSYGRVLTSAENIKIIEVKKMEKKQKEEALKAEWKQQKEEKQRLKEAMKSCNKLKATASRQSG